MRAEILTIEDRAWWRAGLPALRQSYPALLGEVPEVLERLLDAVDALEAELDVRNTELADARAARLQTAEAAGRYASWAATRIAAVEAERDAACTDASRRATHFHKERDQMRAWLREHGRHAPTCNVICWLAVAHASAVYGRTCTCGLDDALGLVRGRRVAEDGS